MSDIEIPAEKLAIIEVVAGAIREELGEEIDAYPGCRDPEGADPLNRAFRAVVGAILATAGIPAVDLAATVSRSLLVVATMRLAAEGWVDVQVGKLVEEEPGCPDDWMCFLALSSRQQIEPLLDPDRT